MTDELKIMLDNESLTAVVRSNLIMHMGKSLTQENIGEITLHIIESITYFLNKKEGSE